MRINYALVVHQGNSVIHASLYEDQPEQSDVDHLIDELKNDEEFGLTHLTGADYEITEITGDELVRLKTDLEIPDELGDEPGWHEY